MKCLDETPLQVAKRMRQLAAGMAKVADAEAIRRYADWVEANPEAAETQELGEQPDLDRIRASEG